MALKRKYGKKEEIPAGFETLFVERDGAFVADMEADPRVEEMRAASIAAQKELRDFKAQFEGIDASAFKALQAEKQRLEDEQRIKDGKAEEVWKQRESALLERVHKPVLAEVESLRGTLSGLLIDQAVVSEATKRGLRPTAILDVTARARSAFKLVGGVPTSYEADGQTVRRGKDGVAAMTLAEWVETLGTDAPHLFEANAGSGAAGSASGGGAGGKSGINPWDSATENLTEQMRLLRSNPSLAARLQAAAKK